MVFIASKTGEGLHNFTLDDPKVKMQMAHTAFHLNDPGDEQAAVKTSARCTEDAAEPWQTAQQRRSIIFWSRPLVIKPQTKSLLLS